MTRRELRHQIAANGVEHQRRAQDHLAKARRAYAQSQYAEANREALRAKYEIDMAAAYYREAAAEK